MSGHRSSYTALSWSDGEAQVLGSPAVGRFRPRVAEGAWVRGGEVLGELEVLGQRHAVLAPALDGVWALELEVGGGWSPVDHGLTLGRLVAAQVGSSRGASRSEAVKEGLPEGSLVFAAPIDGMFYGSRSPQDPPFVKEGDVIEQGQVVGLIEVMKFFYEIRFERRELGARARVARVEAQSGASIHAGAPLLYVCPV